jgi:hypothetical protein
MPVCVCVCDGIASSSSHLFGNVPFGDKYNSLCVFIQNQQLVFNNNKIPEQHLRQEGLLCLVYD